ncbi:MAG: hypothetical protein RLN60_05390 [Phycisphaerales bacterium]
MNWFVFAIFTWLAIGLDEGLADVFQPFGWAVTPSFAHVLLVFVCVWAPSRSAYAAALIIGAAQDFVAAVPAGVETSQDVVVLGPHALGALLGASLIVNLRSVMIKKSLVSMFVLTFFGVTLLEIVVTASLSIRSIYPNGISYPSPSRALLVGLGSAVYSSLLATVLSTPLNALSGLFHFRSPGPSFPSNSRRR